MSSVDEIVGHVIGDSEHDERTLIVRLRSGDEEAFAGLVTRHHGALCRAAAMYVRPADVDEVVQETWAAVIVGVARFRGESTLRTWIFSILLNQARRRFRQANRTIPFAAAGSGEPHQVVEPDALLHHQLGPNYWSTAPAAWHTDPEGRAIGQEVLQRIAAAITTLRPAQREVITLRDVEGWSSEEVCEALGISAANQRVLLHRARAAVRDELEVYFDER